MTSPFRRDVPVAVINGSEISQVFDGVVVRYTQTTWDSSEILDGSGVMVDEINLLVYLDNLE